MFEKILKTPKDGLNFLMLTFLVYIAAPIFVWFGLRSDLINGKFSANADSIGLGLIQFTLILILSAPFLLALIVWILWNYPPEVSLFGFNHQCPLRSFFWSLIFGFLFLGMLLFSLESFLEGNFFVLIENLIVSYLLLVFRASIIFRKGK